MDVEDFPIEVRLSSERQLREFWQARAEKAERRKIPPERKEIEELERKYRLLQEQYNSLDKMFKEGEVVLLARIEALRAPSIIRQLESERDHWRERWRSATHRIAELLEHQGSIEFLEGRVNYLERQNKLLRGTGE